MDDKNLIFPAFNYDFTRTKIFDVENDPSQVGVLTNYILGRSDYFRSNTPIFSFSSKLKDMPFDNLTPFYKGSVLNYLYDCDGSILFYGAKIDSNTYLHYVESQYDVPYRYNKKFNGKILLDNSLKQVNVEFHVRPLNLSLDYNWDYLLNLLREKQAIVDLGRNFFGVKARDISNIWGEVIRLNPTNILSNECRDSVKNKLNSLGRAFLISDFEDI